MVESNKGDTDYKQRAWASYVEGKSFIKAVKLLDDHKEVTIPLVINAVFACELFLKCILYLEKQDEKIKKGHELKELFDEIDESSKNVIIVESKINNYDKFWEEASDAFKDWRYFYEHKGLKGINTDDLMRFATVAQKIAKEKLYEGKRKYYRKTIRCTFPLKKYIH